MRDFRLPPLWRIFKTICFVVFTLCPSQIGARQDDLAPPGSFWISFLSGQVCQAKENGTVVYRSQRGLLLTQDQLAVLEPLVEEWNSLNEQWEKAPPGKGAELHQRVVQFENDPQLTSSVRDVLGAELFGQLSLEYTAQHVFGSIVSKKEDLPESAFRREQFRNYLGLTAAQRADINELSLELSKLTKAKRVEFFRTRQAKLDSRMAELSDFLTDSQQQSVRARIGKPIDWLRVDQDKELTSLIHQFAVENFQETQIGEAVLKQFRQDEVLRILEESSTIEEFKQKSNNTKLLDSFTIRLLTNKDFLEELELVEFQRTEFDDLLASLRRNSVLTTKYSRDRLEHLIGGGNGEFFDIDFETVLLKPQVEWLCQAELQLRLAKKAETFGLTHPRFASELGLEQRTIQQMEVVAQRSSAEMAIEFEKFSEELLNLTKKQVARLFEILDAKQQKKLTDLFMATGR